MAATILIVLLCLAVVLFITDWISIDLVALGLMLILILSGIISVEEGLSGFSNKATLAVVFMFILSGALLQTGALQYLSFRIIPYLNQNPRKGFLLLMGLVALASAFVNNTPIVAVFIPLILQVSRSTKLSPTKLLIPLSFASIMGGLCTIYGTSTNLLVSGLASAQGIDGIGVFTMTGPALILVFFGLVYLVLLAPKLLPDREINFENYAGSNRNYLLEIQVTPESGMGDVRIMDSKIVRDYKIDILEVRREDSVFSLPPGDFELSNGDILRVNCNVRDVANLSNHANVLSNYDSIEDKNPSDDVKLVEFAIPQNSPLIGKTLRDADFRRRYRSAPLAIRHRDEIVANDLYETSLQSGDLVLAEVKSHYIENLQQMETTQNSPLTLISELPIVKLDKPKLYTVLGAMIAMILSSAIGLVDIVVAAATATAFLAVIGTVKMKEAYSFVNWKIVFLMAGVLSIGIAMNNTGLDTMITDGFLNNLGNSSPYLVLALIYLSTSILTEVISNTATAAIMTPIAIGVSATFGFNAMPFLIAVMFAASASFLTPIGYQTNTMVYDAGNYRFRDFLKVGFGLNIMFLILSVSLIPIFFPF